MRTLLTLVMVALVATTVGADDTHDRPGTVKCANLIYGKNKTSECFADHFLSDTRKITHVNTAAKFNPVRLDSAELFEHPFAVMSGEGAFTLPEQQIENLRAYLTGGGFLVASPGCSSEAWDKSFRKAAAAAFPDQELVKLPMDHPIFRTAYDIDVLKTKRRGVKAELEALILEGRIVMIFSPEGLNDTANAGGGCCCCGGNEILNSRQVNVNLLTYALTH